MAWEYRGPQDEPLGETDETVEVSTPAVEPKLVVLPPGKEDPRHAGKQKGRRMAELMRQGRSREQAAQEAGVTPGEAREDPDVREAVRELLSEYTWAADERRRVIRARLNKVILHGEDKDAIAASKVAGADPEVGLIKDQPAVQVGIFTEATMQFLQRQKDAVEIIKEDSHENQKALADDSGNSGR